MRISGTLVLGVVLLIACGDVKSGSDDAGALDAGTASDASDRDGAPSDGPECPAECDNGKFCDGVDYCGADGTCQDGTPPELDDAIDCTVDSCNETDDRVEHQPDDAACDDHDMCDGIETCDPDSGCLQGSPVQCPSPTTCVDYSCVSTTGNCVQSDRVYSVDYIQPDGSGTVSLTCGSQATIRTQTSSSCSWKTYCEMDAQGAIRVGCQAMGSGCACVAGGSWVTSGCSVDARGTSKCCVP